MPPRAPKKTRGGKRAPLPGTGMFSAREITLPDAPQPHPAPAPLPPAEFHPPQPTPLANDDPFSPRTPPSGRHVTFTRDAEYIDISNVPDSPSSARLPSLPLSPTPPIRAHAVHVTPRTSRAFTGPHSTVRRRILEHRSVQRATEPAGNVRRHVANDVWTFFETEDERRICLVCRHLRTKEPSHHVHTYGPTTGTGALRKHLFTDHIEVWVTTCDQADIKITAKEALPAVSEFRERMGSTNLSEDPNRPSPVVRPYTPEAFVDALLEWIVADDQPINIIESPHLRSIFLMLRQELKDSDIPHRTTLRTRITQVWESHLVRLRHDLKGALGRISTTLDIWSDINLAPFMAVTAHWMEGRKPSGSSRYEIKLRSDLIAFHHLPGRHTGEHLARTFLFILDRLGIANKIGWITADNASNNDTMMSFLEGELHERQIQFDQTKRHIRCFPHIVNLACKSVLEAITDLKHAQDDAQTFVPDQTDHLPRSFTEALKRDPVATIRSVVRVTRASSLRRQYFAEIAHAIHKRDWQLLRDVDTRWSSTLLMIERALLLRGAIDAFLQHDELTELRRYKLSTAEWDALSAVKAVLDIPHAFQQKLSAEKTPTLCDTLPCFEAMSLKWTELQTHRPELSGIIQKGLNKLADYHTRTSTVPAYTLALLLNPSQKLNWFRVHKPGQVENARTLLLSELHPYYHNRPAATPTPNASDPTLWADDILGLDPQPATSFTTLADEVDAYLSDPSSASNTLFYWQEHQLRFPTLFSLAMDILPIQGSSVPCERVFSSGKETMTPRRSRIAPDLMEYLQVLKFSIKKGRGLDFTYGTSKIDEYADLEELNEAKSAIPEEVSAFIRSLGIKHN